MANVPLVSNPIIPPVPDEPKLSDDTTDPELIKTFDSLWKWMKDVSVQLKILFGSPQSSNSAIIATLVQAGTILPFGGIAANIPTGYLVCDGSVVSQGQYVSLFSAIGTNWNTGGEGAGNFRLPDLRGRDILGAGTGAGLSPRAVGQTGGEETHLLTTPELPAHNHPVTDPGHGHAVSDPGHSHLIKSNGGGGSFPVLTGDGSGATHPSNPSTTGVGVTANTTGISTQNTGGGGAHNNVQPFGVCTWMIKF